MDKKNSVPEASSLSDLTAHDHCSTCINARCKYTPCAVAACGQCGHLYHGCKADEHRLLCPAQKVACVNAQYGCEMVVLRSQAGAHLERCPASVVVCSMDWSRASAHFTKNLSFQAMPEKVVGFDWRKPDIVLAIKDQQTFVEALSRPFLLQPDAAVTSTREWLFGDKQQIRCTPSRALSDMFHPPPPPCTFSGNKCKKCCRCKPDNDVSKDYLVMGPRKVCPLRPDSASPSGENRNNGISTQQSPPLLEPSVNILNNIRDKVNPYSMSIYIENLPKYMPKPDFMATFLCGQWFRRDEYPAHFKNFHSEILSGMNGWMEHRCPMFHYGCMHSQARFYPDKVGSKISFSSDLQSFCVEPPTDENCASLAPVDTLSRLPFDVIAHLCRFLDPSSLRNLAAASEHLHDICQSVVGTRGIVTFDWVKRRGDGWVSWTPTQKTWQFSRAATPVMRWGFQENDHMSNHLKICPYNIRSTRTAPYFVPYFVPVDGVTPTSWILANLQAKMASLRSPCNPEGQEAV